MNPRALAIAALVLALGAAAWWLLGTEPSAPGDAAPGDPPARAPGPPPIPSSSSPDRDPEPRAPDLPPAPVEAAPRPEGELATAKAALAPSMSALAIDDDAYDPILETRQLFHPLEVALAAQGKMDAATWDELLSAHTDSREQLQNRADALSRAGQDLRAEAMLTEWDNLLAPYDALVDRTR